jgi:hypothetical protein
MLSGCSTYRVQQQPVADVVAEEPGTIRITRISGSNLVIASPRIEADSIVGTRTQADYRGRVSIALHDVGQIEVLKTNWAATIAIIVVPIAGLFVIGYASWAQ